MTNKKMTVADIEREISKMDPNLSREETTFHIAVAMMAAAIVGPNLGRVAKFTGYSREYLAPFFQSLRENGVFKGGKIYSEWFDKNGGVSFWMDVGVAQGWMKRVAP